MSMMTEMLLMTITLFLIATILPRIYWAFAKVEELHHEQNTEQLEEFLVERNAWVLRHLACGVGAIILIWISKTGPGMEVSSSLIVALGVYAACSLFFAALESLLAHKIHRIMFEVAVKVRMRD